MRKRKREEKMLAAVGSLELYRIEEWASSSAYDSLRGYCSWFEMREGSNRRKIDSMGQLATAMKAAGADFVSTVVASPAEYARIAAELHGLGRVISNAPLFDFVEAEYGIAVSAHLPRIAHGKLSFTTGEFSIARASSPIFRDVSVDLESGAVEVHAVPASKPRGGDSGGSAEGR